MKGKTVLFIALIMMVMAGIFSYILITTSVVPTNGEADITREGVRNFAFQIGNIFARADEEEQYVDYDLGTFTVNLTTLQAQRVLRTRITLEVREEGAVQEIEKRNPQLRDTVITILRQAEFSAEGDIKTESLKNKIKSTINEIIDEEAVRNVWFRELMIR